MLEGNKIIGASILEVGEKTVDSLYLNPDFIGKGFGKELLSFVEKFAKSKGILRLKLYPTEFALNFYKKMGYKIKRKFIGTQNGGYPVTEMEKRLR